MVRAQTPLLRKWEWSFGQNFDMTYYLILMPHAQKHLLTRTQYEHISLESTKTVTIIGKGKYTLDSPKFVFTVEPENCAFIVATVIGHEIRGRDFLK